MVKLTFSVCVAVVVVFFCACLHACAVDVCDSAQNVTVDETFITSENISESSYPLEAIREVLANNSMDFDIIQIALNDAIGTQSVAPCLPFAPMFPPLPPAALFIKRILKGHIEDLLNKLQCPMVPARLLKIDGSWVVGRVPFAVCPPHRCCTVDWQLGECQPVKYVWVCLILVDINPWAAPAVRAVWVLLPVACGCRC